MTEALEGSCLFPLKVSSWVCCEEINAMATPLCMAPASEPLLNIVFILPFLYHLNSSAVCHLSAIWPWTSIHSPFHMLGIRGDSVKAIVLHRAADVWPLLPEAQLSSHSAKVCAEGILNTSIPRSHFSWTVTPTSGFGWALLVCPFWYLSLRGWSWHSWG